MQPRIFDKNDWMAFCGAECWPNDVQPIIAHSENDDGKGTMVLADKNSVLAMVEDDPQNEYGGWTLHVAFPTQALAMFFLAGFPSNFTTAELIKIGFDC